MSCPLVCNVCGPSYGLDVERCTKGALSVVYYFDNVPSCHASCIHNEIEALEKRHLLPQPTITELGCERLRRGLNVLKFFSRGIDTIKPYTLLEVVDSYRGAKRRVYASALEDINKVGMLKRDCLVKAFVKASKYIGEMIPRIIQARSPKYNLLVAQYHKPMEHFIYSLRSKYRTTHVKSTKISAKCDNAYVRAATIRKKMKQFKSPLVVMLDASKFDGHVQLQHQKLAHEYYYYLTRSSKHIKLLARTLSTRGVTASGYKYELGARRASGDMDTAVGNTVIMLFCVCSYAAQFSRYDIYDDGDDCLLFVEEAEFTGEELLKDYFLSMGFKMSCSLARKYSEVVFCRSRPVKLDAGVKMVRNPWLVLDTALASHKYFRTKSDNMLKQFFTGYWFSHQGEPITGAFFGELYRRFGHCDVSDVELSYKVKMSGRGVTNVSSATREHYAKVYGVPPDEQVLVEQLLVHQVSIWDWTTPVHQEY